MITLMCDKCGSYFEQDTMCITNYCTTCAGKVFMGLPDDDKLTEQLELSIIYTQLIKDLDDVSEYQQRLQLVSDAVDAAYAVKHEHAHEWDHENL